MHTKLSGPTYKAIIALTARLLEQHKAEIDALNVYPVPDGDTGTNMMLTMAAAVEEAEKVTVDSLSAVAEAVALGSLMGARGNSGVILSQLFRGFSRAVTGLEQADGAQVAAALQEGVRTAYQAVMKPVEGTILTVAREAAQAALSVAGDGGDLPQIMRAALEEARRSLERTPELLPVLKEAGVVDAGGQGLLCFFEAAMKVLTGEVTAEAPSAFPVSAGGAVTEELPALEHPYDVVVLLRTHSNAEDSLRQALADCGNSLVVIGDHRVAKVHIHTRDPARVLALVTRYGDINEAEIKDMRLQMSQTHGEAEVFPEDEHGAQQAAGSAGGADHAGALTTTGVVAVVVGDGLVEIFRSLGATAIVDGGNTMNPSTEELVRAVSECPARRVIVLPNNPNVILAAQQARQLVSKEVVVMETRSIPQGMAALMSFRPDADLEENLDQMSRAASRVRWGEVTFAVRDGHYGEMKVRKGDILGLREGELKVVGSAPTEVLLELLGLMVEDHHEIITIFHGREARTLDLADLEKRLSSSFAHCEVEVHRGGQPLYYFLVSVE